MIGPETAEQYAKRQWEVLGSFEGGYDPDIDPKLIGVSLDFSKCYSIPTENPNNSDNRSQTQDTTSQSTIYTWDTF